MTVIIGVCRIGVADGLGVGVRAGVGEGRVLVTTTTFDGVGVGDAVRFVPTTRILVGVGDGVTV